MKTTVFVPVLLLFFILLFSGGCSKKIIDAPDPGINANTPGIDGKNINYPPAEYSEEGLPQEGTLDDGTMSSNLSGNYDPTGNISGSSSSQGRTSPGMQPIYFHFDQATVPEDMMEVLIQNANYLKENESLYVIVEGNCDERGSKEYNNALGERRALNTQGFLADLGVHSNRIRTVSYGEEQPIDMGNSETAWAKNRRVDFVTE